MFHEWVGFIQCQVQLKLRKVVSTNFVPFEICTQKLGYVLQARDPERRSCLHGGNNLHLDYSMNHLIVFLDLNFGYINQLLQIFGKCLLSLGMNNSCYPALHTQHRLGACSLKGMYEKNWMVGWEVPVVLHWGNSRCLHIGDHELQEGLPN